MTQTTTAVQIDEILTSLQSDSRANLQRALEGYGEALDARRLRPRTPARTRTSRA